MKKIEKDKITITVDARVLRLAQNILDDLGCSLNDAVNANLYQIFYTKSIPFPLKLPSDKEWEKFDLCQKYRKG